MYLSRLIINPRSREARHDLSDVHQMHRTIMSAFPEMEDSREARADLAVLYRLDVDRRTGRTLLLVQARRRPDWTHLLPGYLSDMGGEVENPATKAVTEALEGLCEGQVLRFRLRANPTKKIDTKTGPDGLRRNGKRVDLRTEPQQIDWLARKAEQGGFRLVPAQPDSDVPAVRVDAAETVKGSRCDKSMPKSARSRRLTFSGVLFEGLLQITHPSQFRRTIEEGVGPGKAFGFGLMSVAVHRR
jgi:CRISPR system Cascade subunit CasE